MTESILKTKAYSFALRTINLSKHFEEKRREFVLSRQVLRSGTSIGANVEEANQAQSKRDFIHKMSIALIEATETNYWLRLLRDSRTLEDKIANSLIDDCEQVQKMLTASIRTSKKGGT